MAILLAGLAGCPAEPPPPGPNLLLITVDTLRADRLACYGGHEDVGRAVCAVAEGGWRYEWAFATAPSTAPSITSILTSRYPSQHGVRQLGTTALPQTAATLAESLEAAGYHTAAFVSNPVLNRLRQLDQGFVIYDDEMPDRELNRPTMAERRAESATDAALAWVRVVEEPWFLWVHYQDPHGPYTAPDGAAVHDADGDEPMPVLRDYSGFRGIPGYQKLPGLRTAAAYEERYLEEIRYLDRNLARLVAGVDARPRPTAILLTADHGEAFGEDDHWFAHGHSLGLDQIRVPLLWRPVVEGSAAGRPVQVSSIPVSTLDVAPTLLAAAGIAPPEPFQGRALPTGPTDERPARPIYAEHPRRNAVVLGRLYYSRDHDDFKLPELDRVTGGPLQPLPPRTAQLAPDTDGSLPAYAPAGGSEADTALETALQEFLATERGDIPISVDVPDDLREQLRALGYLE